MKNTRITRRGFVTAGGVAAASLAVACSAPAPTSAANDPAADVREQHRRLVGQWAEAWNTGNADLMASLFIPDGTYTDNAFQARFQGTEQLRQWVIITLDSIGDVQVVDPQAFGDESRTALRWTFTGTFRTTQPFETATDLRGKSFSVPAFSSFTFADGRIAAVEDFYNLADLMRQLGLPVPYTPPQV